MNKYNRIAIIGSGELGCQILHYSRRNGVNVIGFFDDFESSEKVNNIPILGNLSTIEGFYKENKFDALLLGIGYKHFAKRQKIFDYYKNKGIPFATLIDKTCSVDETAKIGQGTILYANCTIDKNVTINENVLLNISVSIAHNTCVGSHTILAPSAVTAGYAQIGERCFLGVNTTIIDNISICNDTFIGAGSCVLKSINVPKMVWVGVPAKCVRSIE